MGERAAQGHRLTEADRVEIQRRAGAGETFAAAATAVGCSTKSIQRLLARSAGLVVALTMVVLVGLSRAYLGVPRASDIAGGWGAGTVWLGSAVMDFAMLLRLRAERVPAP